MYRMYSRRTDVEEGGLSGPLQWFEKSVSSLDQSDTSGDRGSKGFSVALEKPTGLERGLHNRGPQISPVKGQMVKTVASWALWSVPATVLSPCSR